MTPQDIVDEARTWVGTRFQHQGRSRAGVDCIGLVIMVAQKFNVPYEDMTGYARAPTGPKFLRHLRKFTTPGDIRGNWTGCIGVFRQAIFPCHVGIITTMVNGEYGLINARADWRKVEEHALAGSGFELSDVLMYPGMES